MISVNRLLKVIAIPLFSDNYSYAVHLSQNSNENDQTPCFLIDPADTTKVVSFLNAFPSLIVSHIMYTHKHFDHIGNPSELVNELLSRSKLESNFKVIASQIDGQFIPTLNTPLFTKESLVQSIVDSTQQNECGLKSNQLDVKAIFTPCHTRGHVIYHFKGVDGKDELIRRQENGYNTFEVDECLFTGDTLFVGGCGRFFEGTAQQMLVNMDLIAGLPNKSTKIFCAHEYTHANLQWAVNIEKDNKQMLEKYRHAIDCCVNMVPTIPSSIEDELQTNIFMRTRTNSLQTIFASNDPVYILDTLRTMKNNNSTVIPTP